MKRLKRTTHVQEKACRHVVIGKTCPLLAKFAKNCPYLFAGEVDMVVQMAFYCLKSEHENCPNFMKNDIF